MSRKATCVSFLVALIALGMGPLSSVQAQPRCIIFLIGDGMGFEQVKAAGMCAYGQPGTLPFESFEFRGELTNAPAAGGITDSAAAGTALATGMKVNNGVVSTAIPGDGSELQTLLEYFKERGKSTGLVSTDNITAATPAAFGAHEPSRMNTAQIATDYRTQTRPNVLLGGGGYGMNVQAFEDAGYTVVTDRDAMQALDTENVAMVCGQFGDGPLPYEPNMGSMPHLTEMAETALHILDNDPNGFFLMVECGQIDHAGHSNLTANVVLETVEFNNAVQAAIDWAQGRNDTLIIVTADHETGGLKVLGNNGVGQLPAVTWSTKEHSAANVPVYAWGVNARMIGGIMDNTELFGIVTAGPPLPDFNGDGVVDKQDLELLMGYWGQEAPSRALVARWRLDEAEGSIAKDTVGDHDGLLYGEPLWQPAGGTKDGALRLDGINDYVSTTFVLNPADGPFSVFAWVNGGASEQVILSQESGTNWLMLAPGGVLMTELKQSGRYGKALTSAILISDDAWHRVGLVWDGADRILYVDGVEVARGTQTSLIGADTGLYIGTGKAMEPGTFWSGLIDDVRIYNRAVRP